MHELSFSLSHTHTHSLMGDKPKAYIAAGDNSFVKWRRMAGRWVNGEKRHEDKLLRECNIVGAIHFTFSPFLWRLFTLACPSGGTGWQDRAGHSLIAAIVTSRKKRPQSRPRLSFTSSFQRLWRCVAAEAPSERENRRWRKEEKGTQSLFMVTKDTLVLNSIVPCLDS